MGLRIGRKLFFIPSSEKQFGYMIKERLSGYRVIIIKKGIKKRSLSPIKRRSKILIRGWLAFQ